MYNVSNFDIKQLEDIARLSIMLFFMLLFSPKYGNIKYDKNIFVTRIWKIYFFPTLISNNNVNIPQLFFKNLV